MSQQNIYRLACKTQSYDWGKLGETSKVAEFASATPPFKTDATKPYAELWMGTHPSGPSFLYEGEKSSLKDLIVGNEKLVTPRLYKDYAGDLPFLFKVLSIRKALSIQAHPDKTLGAELHKQFPDIYKDPNHKPEMAIAISPFEALCGFRPLDEIKRHLEQYAELRELVGNTASHTFLSIVTKHGSSDADIAVQENKEALSTLFTALMTSPQETVTNQLERLKAKLDKEAPKGSIPELIIRLDKEYPGGDVGIFAVLLLNYIELKPGQAIFLGANEPHAYLSGDCMECMATSDNVVRAGLTPKFKDVVVLTKMLTYRYGSANAQIMSGASYENAKHSILYDPPIDEFSVIVTVLASSGEVEELGPINGPSILIATEGNGKLIAADENEFELGKGFVYFVGAGEAVKYVAQDQGLTVYRAIAIPV